MMITREDIKKVLALFDDDDIPYVLSDWIVRMMSPKENEASVKMKKEKVKIKGDRNERPRK